MRRGMRGSAWLDTGVAPTADDFAGAVNLTMGFEPGPWPQPSAA